MRHYNAADVDQCYELLRRLIRQTRKEEVKLIDMTIRMLVEPQFGINMDLLINTLADESARKQANGREWRQTKLDEATQAKWSKREQVGCQVCKL